MQTYPLDRAVAPDPDPLTAALPPNIRAIRMSNGGDAFCDAADFAFLSHFTWKVDHGVSVDYPVTALGGQLIRMHHLILRDSNRRRITHVDGDHFNNCRANLSIRPPRQSPTPRDQRGKRRNRTYTSQYKGVSKPKISNRWYAAIKVEGKYHWLGSFFTEEEAALAYDAAARRAFGDITYQNFPNAKI